MIFIVLFFALIAIIFIFQVNDNKKDITDNTNNDVITIIDVNKIYSIRGYYSTYDILMYPPDYDSSRDPYPSTTTCQAFTVLDGDSEPISYYRDLIKNGNTLNRLDSKDNLILNIKTSDLSLEEKNIIFKSSKQKPINLNLKMKPEGESDANYCDSMVNLVSVN